MDILKYSIRIHPFSCALTCKWCAEGIGFICGIGYHNGANSEKPITMAIWTHEKGIMFLFWAGRTENMRFYINVIMSKKSHKLNEMTPQIA